MHVVSVNVGSRRTVRVGERAVETGIGKRSVDRAVVTPSGLVDDEVVDTRHHGGADQAVYVYAAEDYRWWADELGRDDLHPGLFGENLTIEFDGMGPLAIGDRLSISGVELEVTAPRIPCAVFAATVGEERWVARFNEARRHGAYCRVIVGGIVHEGDRVGLDRLDGAPSVESIADLHLDPRADEARLRSALAMPLAARAREDFLRRLARRA